MTDARDLASAALDRGDHAAASGNVEAALARYREAQSFDPSWFRGFLNAGEILLRSGQLKPAEAELAKSVQVYGGFPLGQFLLGEARVRQGHFKEALAPLETAVTLAPEVIRYRCWLSRALAMAGYADEAAVVNRNTAVRLGWTEAEHRGYEFVSEGWFLAHIPAWNRLLGSHAGKPHVRILEIGSFEGMSACWLADKIATHATSLIVCVDPEFQPQFEINRNRTGAASRIRPIRAMSQDVSDLFDPNSFDFVYVDGMHQAPEVFIDALSAWRVAKPGSLIIFDDYLKPEQKKGQPCSVAIDAMCKLFADSIEILGAPYQLFLRKTTDKVPADAVQKLIGVVVDVTVEAPQDLKFTISKFLDGASELPFGQSLPLIRQALAVWPNARWPQSAAALL